jgi:epoxyqueuosine reductase
VTETATAAIRELERRGFRARTVSVQHLPELREDIEKWQRQGLLDQSLATAYLQFGYDAGSVLPGARTIFIVAIPQPITRAGFIFEGRRYVGDVPPTYIGSDDDARVKETLASVIQPAGGGMARVRLPVKTLAVRSGLAQYGRNNITYVPEFGSFHRLAAFAADCACEQDNWNERSAMQACHDCSWCADTCPTGCIPRDRFLIHAENCLTWHNERPDKFADWIEPTWHHALVGCLRCQSVCPANKRQVSKIVPGPQFSEAETLRLLQEPALTELPEETRQKLASIAMDDSYDVLGRNLEALIRSRDLNANMEPDRIRQE